MKREIERSGLHRYISYRLGSGSDFDLLQAMVRKSFTATRLHAFWWYFNPVYGYFLGTYIFKPLRKMVPHHVAFFLTYLFCGFVLHDLPIVMLVFFLYGIVLPFPLTQCFALLAVINLLGIGHNITLEKLSACKRVGVHLAVQLGSLLLATASTVLLLRHFGDVLTII